MRGGTLEVIGQSAVVILDPRRAKIESAAAGAVVAASGVVTSVLREGMTYDFAR